MITTVQTKNEYTLETYPEAPMPSASMPKESQSHVVILKRWAWGLGRLITYNQLPSVAGEEKLSMVRINQNLTDETFSEMAISFHEGMTHFDIPPDGIEQIAKKVEDHLSYWGEIEAPMWCHRAGEAYEKLFLVVLIYGANGRKFPFATRRTADALGVSWRAVQNFVRCASGSDDPMLEVVQKGRSNRKKFSGEEGAKENEGRYTMLMLCESWRKRWNAIRPRNGTEREENELNRTSFGEYLQKCIPWCVGSGSPAYIRREENSLV